MNGVDIEIELLTLGYGCSDVAYQLKQANAHLAVSTVFRTEVKAFEGRLPFH
jgi:hypothetical protein